MKPSDAGLRLYRNSGRVALAALALALAAACAGARAQEDQPAAAAAQPDWQAMAEADVLASYAAYVKNHPGMYDLENPGFPAQLAAARDAGLLEAEGASGEAGYRRALAAFSAELADGHALAFAQPVPAGDGAGPSWPGFAALWRGDGMIAATPDASSPLNGAAITHCDGTPIRPFLKSALLTRYFRPEEAGQWWRRPSQLFYSNAGLPEDAPAACTFELKDGTVTERALEWTQPSKEEEAFVSTAANGERVATALTEPRSGLFMIGLQDFQPDADGVKAFEALYDDVRAQREDLLGARAVILDLRRNNGGASAWSRDLAKLLWGEAAMTTRDVRGTSVYWRASEGNIAHLREGSVRIREQGHTALADDWLRFADEMEAARDRGEPLWKQAGDSGSEAAPDPAPTDFDTPVYVITHGGCASACLDALDYFTRFENTRLIGAPTSADSTYMEVRIADLPAGPGRIVIPTKVYSGRPRGWGEVYTPDILMTDADWSTARFLDWIERDLAAR